MAGAPLKRARREAEAARLKGEAVSPLKKQAAKDFDSSPLRDAVYRGTPVKQVRGPKSVSAQTAPRAVPEDISTLDTIAGFLGQPELFEKLLGLSIQRALDIMSIDITAVDKNGRLVWEDEKMHAKIMSTQQSIASSVFSTTARVNDANLRKIQGDKLQGILDTLQQEQDQMKRQYGEPDEEADRHKGEEPGKQERVNPKEDHEITLADLL